jgi:hypothetical protein
MIHVINEQHGQRKRSELLETILSEPILQHVALKHYKDGTEVLVLCMKTDTN